VKELENDKTATLLGVLRATVSKVMSAYTNHGKSTFKEEQWAEINIDRKRSLYMRIVLKNHTPSSEWVTAELNIHL
jgi:hypothetical protein